MSAGDFLGLDDDHARLDDARVVVLPVPLEATVSWTGGTAGGPAAIIAASQQVELYDREHDAEPALQYGVHTLDALELPSDPARAVARIATAVADAARTGKLVVALGGEHTISAGVSRGVLDALGGPLTVVQLDAHCDLRDAYDGSPYSHACVTRRMLDDPRVEQALQLGIRSVDVEEVRWARANPERVRVWYAEEVHAGRWREELRARLEGRRVHLTIDVDGLDPSIVPATGTPEPDGLTWTEALDIVRTTAAAARIVAIDCVELAPRAGLHAADFAVAKLVYKTVTYALRHGG
ncbi:MAG: agmatinase [Solirubrobacteraceae bacterium]|jgi:agmatinase|nr:agmatinase [Solirubrobacteraceae bacterium]